jgi:hypothetical protein
LERREPIKQFYNKLLFYNTVILGCGPGIDIDIPTAPDHSKCTPDGTKEAVLAAFRAGSQGVILSRKYSEMMLADLKDAGAAFKQLGIA